MAPRDSPVGMVLLVNGGVGWRAVDVREGSLFMVWEKDMVVKAVRGRRRYVVFQLSAPLTKNGLVSGFRFYGRDKNIRVVQCLNKLVILGWFIPKDVEGVISLMKRVDPLSRSLLTSGTIASLRRRYSALRRSHLPVGVK